MLLETFTNSITGNFNFKKIYSACIDVSENSPHYLFSKFLLGYDLCQFLMEPTQKASNFELILYDNMYTIDHIYFTENFSTPDHSSVSFFINTFLRRARNITSIIPGFAKADWDNMGHMLSLIN